MSRDTVIQDDAVVKGSIRYGRKVEIHGYVEGDIVAEQLLIAEKGRVFGRVRAGVARVEGEMQGEISVKALLDIASGGHVSGNVVYGRITMAEGGTLSADLKNVPPELAGDFQIDVARGRAALVTVRDLAAIDPDDRASDLHFTVSKPRNGWVAMAGAPDTPVEGFTQADIDAGQIVFKHDGSAEANASFDIVVADKSGATSGAARTVEIAVSGGP